MYLAAEMIGTMADTLLLAIFLNSFYFARESLRKYVVWAFVFFDIFFSILSLFPQQANLRILCTFAAITLICFLFYESTILQSVFTSIAFSAMYMLVDILCLGILTFIHITPNQILQVGDARVLSILMARLIFLVIIMVFKIFSKKQNGTVSFRWVFPLLPGQILSIGCCMSTFKSLIEEKRGLSLQEFLFLITLVYINVVIVFYVELLRSNEIQQKQYALCEQQYEIQRQYYQRLHETQEETRALWHDIKKYLAAIQTVIGKSERDAGNLVEEVNQIVDEICPVVDIGNSVVSAILDEYRVKTTQLDVQLQLDISIPETLGISPIDLYVILGNTLDNALDACSALCKEKRWINIKMRKRNQMLLYCISNAKTDQVLIQRLGSYHGYGLKNVRRSVEKYAGEIQIKDESDKYIVTIRMNCK